MLRNLGSPAEYYTFGSGYSMVIVADIVACFTAAFVYLPIYYNLGVTSIYEYLEIRFGRTSRVCLTGMATKLRFRLLSSKLLENREQLSLELDKVLPQFYPKR